MENIPFRSSGSSGRGNHTPQKEAEPEPKPAAPAPVERPRSRPVSRHDEAEQSAAKKRLPLIIAAVAVIIIGVIVAAWFLSRGGSSNTLTTIDSGKYQAVTLTNGDIYFGKLQVLGDQYVKMSDIYYLKPQADTGTETKDSVSQNFNLTKFTDVPFSPEDEMTIPKTQILHFENMQPDGKVAQLIDQYKKSNN